MTPEGKIRLGGMALVNGVLVHGPTAWACAIRTRDGRVEVASAQKTLRSSEIESPLLRVPARLAEAIAVLPAVGRALPEAELPFKQVRVLAAMAGSLVAARALRASRLSPLAQETSAALLALVPVGLALRGTQLAAYHGAEHMSIGSYEHDEPRPREHERCGSHLLGPLLVSTVLGSAVAGEVARTPRGKAAGRLAASLGAVAFSGELLGWAIRHPDHPASKALSWPGRELQHRFLTAEPTEEQLEVAQAALDECLRLERAAAEGSPLP